MSQPWFRFYRAVVHNPKIQKLPDALFKAWVNVLCCTDDDGILPATEDIAFALRISERKVCAILESLIDARLLTDDEGVITAHDWADHQRKSDSSKDRVAKLRERRRNVGGDEPGNGDDDAGRNDQGNGDGNVTQPVTRNGAGNVTGNAPDTEEDTEQNRAEQNSVGSNEPTAAHAARIADEVWKSGLGYLAANGIAERRARSVIGKWRKTYQDGAVLDALIAAQREAVAEPVAWITKALAARSRPKPGQEAGQNPAVPPGHIRDAATGALYRIDPERGEWVEVAA